MLIAPHFRARFKASETLLGIETQMRRAQKEWTEGFKASETLLGIETSIIRLRTGEQEPASKPLKPF